jgi:hypothetical protein
MSETHIYNSNNINVNHTNYAKQHFIASLEKYSENIWNTGETVNSMEFTLIQNELFWTIWKCSYCSAIVRSKLQDGNENDKSSREWIIHGEIRITF